ncbi:hypothetical protein CWI76_00300 [Pseudidiomarina marina]|uniref:Uncharacterized protein n=1 Tax=Pseudidiomarina marina TaxID=502366 RepID=A0A432YIS2_9GAMM|nr:hypothetical protein CWI76_00300 [Pseudidiomarina marina]
MNNLSITGYSLFVIRYSLFVIRYSLKIRLKPKNASSLQQKKFRNKIVVEVPNSEADEERSARTTKHAFALVFSNNQ